MSKKTAIGIINTSSLEVYNACKKTLPTVDYMYEIHHTSDSSIIKNNYNRYISYGGLYNVLLRQILETDADYIFLIKSSLLIEDKTVFEDYITAAKNFGTWFMARGSKQDKHIPIEDDLSKITINLFENLSHNFIFMLKSHITNCGMFNESYTNFSNKDNTNCLEIYDFYHKVENKIDYLPKGYFPDTELSLAKIAEQNAPNLRPSLREYTNDSVTKIYGQFLNNNKFIPGQHKTATQEEAISKLEKIQKIYGKII